MGFLGGAKGSSAPTEDPNTLRSAAFAKLLFLLCKGPIKGFVGATLGHSLQVDGVPLVSPDGTLNYKGWNTYSREGSPIQEYVPGISQNRQVESVNRPVLSGFPIVRPVFDPDTDAVEVRIKIPALREYKDDGDVTGARTRYIIEIRPNGESYETKVDQVIEGKTNSPYQRSHEIRLNGNPPWDIRVLRPDPDSRTDKLQDAFEWEALTLIEYDKRRYNGHALVGLEIDSKQFSQVGNVSVEIDGQIVLTPHNYDPIARTYSGAFNGTLIPQWCQNPVWVLYDLLLDFISPSQILVYDFYEAAQYCDERIGDDTRSRFTFNHVFSRREQAFKVAQAIAATFNGKLIPRGSKIGLMVDKPKPISRNFGLSDMVGDPVYTRASNKDLSTVATVTYTEPNQNYEAVSFAVTDQPGYEKWGYRPTDITALGCTDREQAYRTALWVLATPRLQPIQISFEVASAGLLVLPGEVISITDSDMQGDRTSGRIVAHTIDANLGDTIEIDHPYRFDSGPSYAIKLIGVDGLPREYAVNVDRILLNQPTKAIAIVGNVSAEDAADPGMPWHIVQKNQDLSDRAAPSLFIVTSVAEVDRKEADNTFRIEGILYNESKYAYIDSLGRTAATEFVKRGKIDLSGTPAAPTGLSAVEARTTDRTGNTTSVIVLSWGYPENALAALSYFEAEYRAEGDIRWLSAGTTTLRSLELANIKEGRYEFRVAAYNRLGIRGDYGVRSGLGGDGLLSLTGAPLPVQNLTLSKTEDRTVHLKWNPITDTSVLNGGYHRIKHTPRLVDADWLTGTIVAHVQGHHSEATLPLQQGTYMIRSYNASGEASVEITKISTEYALSRDRNVIYKFDESPNYAGSKDKTVVVDGLLRLGNQETWDSIPAPFDAFPGPVDAWGVGADISFTPQGYYYFSSSLKMGGVYPVHLYPVVDVAVIGQEQIWDNIPAPFDNAPPSAFADTLDLPPSTDFGATPYAKIQISLSQDNGITFTDWIDLVPGEYIASDVKARAVLATDFPSLSPVVKELQLIADVPDRDESGRVTTSALETTVINYANPFYAIPTPYIFVLDGADSDRVNIVSETESSIEFQILTAASDRVSRTVSYLIKGFGLRR